MNKIALIAYGTGGAEAFNLIYKKINKLNIKDLEIKVVALSEYAINKLDEYVYVDEKNIFAYIKTGKPSLIINERSNGLEIQNKITKYCKDNSIKNIVFLDLYNNYLERFKEMPELIMVPSESIKNDLLSLGFNENILKVTGNPAFDRLSNYEYKKLEFDNKFLFTSQPLERNNQFEVFKEMHNYITKYKSNAIVDVKPHPMENDKDWIEFLKDCPNTNVIRFDNKKDPLELCLDYSLIFGYNSTIQFQTEIMGIPTVYYSEDMESDIRSYFLSGEINKRHKYIDFEKNAIEKCVLFILNDELKLYF